MINLSPEAKRFLDEENKRTQVPRNIIVENLIMGKHIFPPDLEARIMAKSRELNVPHSVVIERALMAYFGLGK